MIFFGLILVGGAAYYLLSQHISERRAKAEEYTATLRLLKHIRGALSSGGGRLCDILHGFASKPLSDNRLLHVLCTDEVRGAEGSGAVFFRDSLQDISFLIDAADAKRLVAYFEDFGKGYIEEEKRRLSEITEYFSLREKEFIEKSEKDIKAARIIFAFAFVGAFILLL